MNSYLPIHLLTEIIAHTKGTLLRRGHWSVKFHSYIRNFEEKKKAFEKSCSNFVYLPFR